MLTSRSIATSLRQAKVWWSVALPGLVATLALAVAVIAGTLTGSTADGGVNGYVDTISGRSGTFLGSLGVIIPLGFAFAAGLVSCVNPCGFAMLPAYLGLYLGDKQQGEGPMHPARLLGQALLVSGAVTAGFVVLFSVAGVAIGLGAHSIVEEATPWFGLAIGVALAVAGAWVLSGGKLYSSLAARAAAHMGDPGQVSVRGYFLFGLGYGTASLSCTLPIFLIVVGTSLAVSDVLTSLGQFVVYALGMGVVIMALTIGMALFKGVMVGALRRALPYVQPVGALLMIMAGSYLVFYWLTIRG